MTAPAIKKKSILGAMTKATFAWFFLHLLAFQIMVAIQWDTVEKTVYNQVVEEVEVLVPSEAIIEEIVVEDSVALDEVIKARSEELLHRLKDTQLAFTEGIESLESSVDLLIHNSKQEMEYPEAPAVTEEASFPSLESLLKLTTLRTTNDAELYEMLIEALNQLEEVSSSVTLTRAWVNFLQAEEFERESAGEVPVDCPQYERPEGARQSDLKGLLAKIRHVVDEERQGRIIDEILEDVGESVIAAQADRFEPIQLLPPTHEVESSIEVQEDDRICLMEEDLRDMIEVAKSSKDLRMALTQVVKELEPEAHLILDAPLPVSNDASSPQHQIPTTLRQALNSEWIWHISTSTLDALADLTSGYHDGIDGALDSLLAQYGGNEESSVGRIVVSRLLDIVGNLGLPSQVVKLYNETKAGMLRA